MDLSIGAASVLGGYGINAVREITVGQLGAVAEPKPASIALLGSVLLGMIALRRRRRNRTKQTRLG